MDNRVDEGVVTTEDIQEKFYGESYSKVISKGFIGFLQSRVHRSLEKHLSKKTFSDILEFGAGNLEHLKYSSLHFERYLATDIRYSHEEISSQRQDNPSIDFNKVELRFMDAGNPELERTSFDLILATCVLIHLSNPEHALREWRRAVKNSGEIAIYVPAEPGILLRFGRRIFVVPKHKKLGIENSDLLYAREHVSSFYVLETLISEVFKDCNVKRNFWPFPFIPSWNLNAAAVFTIAVPD